MEIRAKFLKNLFFNKFYVYAYCNIRSALYWFINTTIVRCDSVNPSKLSKPFIRIKEAKQGVKYIYFSNQNLFESNYRTVSLLDSSIKRLQKLNICSLEDTFLANWPFFYEHIVNWHYLLI